MSQRKEMFLIRWRENGEGKNETNRDTYYSLEEDDIAVRDDDVMGKITLSEEASSFLKAISLLDSITDADSRELSDPINEIVTECIKIIENHPKQS